MIENHTLSEAALKLYRHLLQRHWNGQAIVGPDPGIRFNSRIGRFVKSYLSFLPWSDCLAYAQAQKYWILSNWMIADRELLDKAPCEHIALACSRYLCEVQQPAGYWEYPNPEWRGRIAAVEGNYAAASLLESYLRTQYQPFLEGAKKWYDYCINQLGFQKWDEFLAINYFANGGSTCVPNVSASALRTFALLAKAADDSRYLEPSRGMVRWLNSAQLDSGELPYALSPSPTNPQADRIHFLCYQYNAFQFLNLADYHGFSQDDGILPLLQRLARFVAQGVTESGALRYDCHHEKPEVLYYSAAAAAALSRATALGLGDYHSEAARAYRKVLSHQTPRGFAFYSRRNYFLICDRRSYPRYLSMILYHLLSEITAVGSLLEASPVTKVVPGAGDAPRAGRPRNPRRLSVTGLHSGRNAAISAAWA